MRIPTSEFIWQGRLHLGDEPGVFGDATYVGLAVELPLTLTKTASISTADLTIRAENVQVIPPYPGHVVTVVSYEDGQAKVVGNAQIGAQPDNQPGVDTKVALDLSTVPFPAFVGVRIHVDTTVPPGLYDDFVIAGLRLNSSDNSVIGQLGFRS
ncbi:hypothetical protein [Mycobacterium nebraskense]|uniref:Uncharacterized protein n=1 Tax=Mycobacterium nebraskense TaxID=244292 RepID=A0A1X1ZRB9_9MYCO|nr:hypothetical protein [Mycobacterium nebraskense]KKC05223.1 hypothetical protein WU83_09560 [Mycobacterium nebraskense]MBI2696698.1 hypothetical protein [Mycobacterium nebraskense]MCV7117956.1 hypothetical protein [Mycobacterium nebraskense]ORW25641.1 hypothetical protein AWC17_01705 [Mycobacterium nebraskense]